MKIIVETYNSLSLEKALTLYNIVILLKSVFNKYENNYNIFLEKVSYKLSRKNDNIYIYFFA